MKTKVKDLIPYLKTQGFQPALTKTGGSIVSKQCPTCDYAGALIFKNTKEEDLYMRICPKCLAKETRKKRSTKSDAPSPPANNTPDNI